MSKIFIGKNASLNQIRKTTGDYVDLDGERFYKIANYDAIRPFFISLVSPSDHWLFISSTGGLSAGRRNKDSALFPYYTDDKLAQSAEITGNKSIILVQKGEDHLLWEPFSERYKGVYAIDRNLYKNVTGNRLIFEEINRDLGLTYTYSWEFSEEFGFVKRTTLTNNKEEKVAVRLLDGLQNILPYGIQSDLQNFSSNLANAYKRSELAMDGLGVFALSSMIVDRAEPSEALKASAVWTVGLSAETYLLSSIQLDEFRQTGKVSAENDVKAEPGAFFAFSKFSLEPQSKSDWLFAADVNQDYADIVDLKNQLSNREELKKKVESSIHQGTESLRKKVALADGLQLTADQLITGRHFSNVLFNIMRGGLFEDQYLIYSKDLSEFVSVINKKVFEKHQAFFKALPEHLMVNELVEEAKATNDLDLLRICREYLPISFSRRHGDPSRPWNMFSIELKNPDGSINRYYAGNWRDIFQNWEALATSIPGFTNAIIARFVNASTIDGYNPYRINRDGIDWEVIEPDDPWSYIGYWGDHQIIYLQKLLELSVKHYPDQINHLLSEESFVYANVPYRIKGYEDIVKDPQDTIDYDHNEAAIIDKRVATYGSDGKLVFSGDQLMHANLTEKLMVMVLAKLSNFVPEAGIWLNTQRPEWNDANNALVGNGVSMVTLYYLRRNLDFLKELFSNNDIGAYNIHVPVYELFKSIESCLLHHKSHINKGFSDQIRKVIVDQLGQAGERYRNKGYSGFGDEQQALKKKELIAFFDLTIEYIDQSISVNKRNDGLYHAYNLITFKDDELKISYLYEMLEGQVAALSSGIFNLSESLAILDALKASDIYREDQYSYMLYPNRDLPKFLERNTIPADFISKSELAQKLLAENDRRLIVADSNDGYHFNGTFNNVNSLKARLNEMQNGAYGDLVNKEYNDYLAIFEEMFDHKSFTGRSGTFFGYEGLGSIYWHMVSKLLLAVQECIWNATDEEKSSSVLSRMIDHYYEIRAGIGINKSPELYGSFPTDPYSHTPGNKGAQQPGMTGQVKEDILNRWAELGVRVKDGKISFTPLFLNPEEYLKQAKAFDFYDVEGNAKTIELCAGELAFTYCQVPVVYKKSGGKGITIFFRPGESQSIDSYELDRTESQKLFDRTREIEKLVIEMK